MPMMNGFGAVFWPVILLLVAVVGITVAFLATAMKRSDPDATAADDPAEDALRMRFARGEVGVEDYERDLALLRSRRS